MASRSPPLNGGFFALNSSYSASAALIARLMQVAVARDIEVRRRDFESVVAPSRRRRSRSNLRIDQRLEFRIRDAS